MSSGNNNEPHRHVHVGDAVLPAPSDEENPIPSYIRRNACNSTGVVVGDAVATPYYYESGGAIPRQSSQPRETPSQSSSTPQQPGGANAHVRIPPNVFHNPSIFSNSICRDFLRNRCTRPNCRYYHPSPLELMTYSEFFISILQCGQGYTVCPHLSLATGETSCHDGNNCRFHHPANLFERSILYHFGYRTGMCRRDPKSQQIVLKPIIPNPYLTSTAPAILENACSATPSGIQHAQPVSDTGFSPYEGEQYFPHRPSNAPQFGNGGGYMPPFNQPQHPMQRSYHRHASTHAPSYYSSHPLPDAHGHRETGHMQMYGNMPSYYGHNVPHGILPNEGLGGDFGVPATHSSSSGGSNAEGGMMGSMGFREARHQRD